MPVKREDAYRALEMLERYHSRLVKPQDRQLRSAIERVIRIFKGRLFQALLDIQEYYELTLLNEAKSLEEKTQETNQVVSRWERQPPILANKEHSSNGDMHKASRSNYSLESEEMQPPSPTHNNLYGKVNKPSKKPSSSSSQPTPDPLSTILKESEQWEMEEILLERGGTGLGFSIAGGVDNPHVDDDPGVYVTKVIEGGTADLDGRLRVNDIVVSVNDVNTENVTHAQTVDALKRAGKNVKLVVKRLISSSSSSADNITPVELVKAGRGLGFSIAGGVDSQHIEGDDSIYITKLSERGAAKESGLVSPGDKLLAVNDTSLERVTHEEAVSILKSTKDRVKLLISKQSAATSWPQLPPQLPPQQPRSQPRQQYNDVEEDDDDDLPPAPVKPKPAKKPATARKPKVGGSKDQGTSSGSNSGTAMGRAPRNIVLKKGSSGLGFNIVGEEAEGIFVSYILQGGPADQSGRILKGDQILSVNGIDMRQATHDQAAAALKGAGDAVEMVVQYRLDEYNQFEAKIHDLREQMLNVSSNSIRSNTAKGLFIRALFQYAAEDDSENPGKGVSFKFGDVFHVVNALDDDWWQVQKVIPEEDSLGVIPSQQRVERNEKARLKNIKKKKKKDKKVENVPEAEDETITSYEPMVQKEVDYARPVIVLGPFKDQLNNDLLSEYPEFFENCVPHTTRAKREGEVNGRDYHFVTSREQMEQDIEDHLFIEAGQYSDNLYGTSIQSVRDVALKDKHCVLDVSANAIKRLRVANLHPIAILIKPHSLDYIKQWSSKESEEQSKKMYERAVKLEKEYGLYFTVLLSANTLEEVYEEVKNSIQNHSGSLILIPAPRENEN